MKNVDFNGAWQRARAITLKIFAEDNSASVQATMYKMGEQILADVPLVEEVDYVLPNKHYFEIGMFCTLHLHDCLANKSNRPQLVQGPQEHRQKRYRVRAPVRP
jgi:urate oxidase